MRKLFLLMYVVALLLFNLPSVFAAADDSCDCPKLTCNAECEVEQDLTFYSEKCEAGKRVKSCARPTCVAIQNAPASCGMVKLDSKTDATTPSNRMPASETKAGESVGRVSYLDGNVKRVMSSDKKVSLTVGDEVFEGDRLETDAASKVQILFNNSGNQMNLTPNSVVVITEASDSTIKKDQNKKRVILDLIKGKVRNKVNQSYNGDQNYFRVRTGGAVAGVRGTDFVVSIDGDDKNITAKIETLEGKVELSDAKFEEKSFIAKGEGGNFVSPKDDGSLSKGKADFVSKGHLTPVYKMTAEQIANLQIETNFSLGDSKNLMLAKNKTKVVQIEDLPICSSPTGKLNQCAWTCEKNPLGETKCRTDLPEVSCVRRVCNANGVWSKPTRLPASRKESCQSNVPVVKACDY